MVLSCLQQSHFVSFCCTRHDPCQCLFQLGTSWATPLFLPSSAVPHSAAAILTSFSLVLYPFPWQCLHPLPCKHCLTLIILANLLVTSHLFPCPHTSSIHSHPPPLFMSSALALCLPSVSSCLGHVWTTTVIVIQFPFVRTFSHRVSSQDHPCQFLVHIMHVVLPRMSSNYINSSPSSMPFSNASYCVHDFPLLVNTMWFLLTSTSCRYDDHPFWWGFWFILEW